MDVPPMQALATTTRTSVPSETRRLTSERMTPAVHVHHSCDALPRVLGGYLAPAVDAASLFRTPEPRHSYTQHPSSPSPIMGARLCED